MKAPAKLSSFLQLRRCRVEAQGAGFGVLEDLYVDQSDWSARFLLVDGSGLQVPRRLLISPDTIESVDLDDASIRLDLSKWRVAAGPETSGDQPVHRQYEREFAKYEKWIPHWQEIGAPVPIGMRPRGHDKDIEANITTPLLSLRELCRYTVHLNKDHLAALVDFLVDVDDWIVRYACIRLSEEGEDVRRSIPVSSIEATSWLDKSVVVGLSAMKLRSMAPAPAERLLTPLQEVGLHRHFGIAPYWKCSREEGGDDGD